LQHIVVPKPQDAVAVVPQEFIPFLIALCLNTIAVMSTVQFDDNSLCMARKINKVWSDRRLSAEMRGASRQLPKL